MSLLSWKEYRSGKRVEEPEVKIEIPTPEIPTLEVVRLNGMSVEQLQETKGIGPKTAEKIVAGQPYKKLGDLAETISEPLYRRVCEKLSANE